MAVSAQTRSGDLSEATYLRYLVNLSGKLNSADERERVYAAYKVDYKHIGLKFVPKSEFVDALGRLSSKEPAFKKQLAAAPAEIILDDSGSKVGDYGVDFMAICGSFELDLSSKDGFARINNQKVTSQKIAYLGKDGIKIDMGLMPARDGNNYGFQYIRRPGTEKRFLNVQLLQNSMDAPKVIGSFPCKKVNG